MARARLHFSFAGSVGAVPLDWALVADSRRSTAVTSYGWPLSRPAEGKDSSSSTDEAAAVRDHVDWNRLIDCHDRRVIVSLLAAGLSIEEAKEVAQDTWIRLVEQHRCGNLERLLLPQLAIRQARFLASDRRRKQQRRRSLVRRFSPGGSGAALVSGELWEGEQCDGVADLSLDLDVQLDARARLRLALDVVDGCSETARAVFDGLYGRAGAPAADVAAKLGLSVQRVRQIACELRTKIRRAWEVGHV